MNLNRSSNCPERKPYGVVSGNGNRPRFSLKRLWGVPLVLLSGLLASCVSPPSSPAAQDVPTNVEAALQEIRSDISAAEYGNALEAILRRKADPAFDPLELDGLYTDTVRRLGAAVSSAADAGEYTSALSGSRSLRALGADPEVNRFPERELLLRAALQKLDEKSVPAALLLFERARFAAGPEDVFTAERLLRFGEAAFAGGYGALLTRIAGQLSALGHEPPPGWLSTAGKQSAPADFLRGMATVLVNKGMKIRSGVGYPDRVLGSAFFIDSRGYLLTNYHVISSEVDPSYEGYSRLFIIPSGSRDRVPARVIGYDRVFDIALLKADVAVPYAFPIVPDLEPRPGDPIFAIGTPAGLENTVTSGIISAVERRLLQAGDVFQIDVPVNPGNSGGPLVDRNGNLIGVVFAGLQEFQGLNFAIPVSWIASILPRLMEGGEAVQSWIGVSLAETAAGLEVMYVVPESPAARLGLSAGDLLVSFADSPVRTLREAQKVLLDLAPGTLATVEYRRAGAIRKVFMATETRPSRPVETAIARDTPENIFALLFGMRVKRSGATFLAVNYVIEKVYGDTTADESGLQAGDPFVIKSWEVNRKEGWAALGLHVKKRKAGFLESTLQLSTYLEIDNFL